MIDGRMINTTRVEKDVKDRFIYKDQIINIFKEEKNERDW